MGFIVRHPEGWYKDQHNRVHRWLADATAPLCAKKDIERFKELGGHQLWLGLPSKGYCETCWWAARKLTIAQQAQAERAAT